METLDVRQRKSAAPGDLEAAVTPREVETALSQGLVSGYEAGQASTVGRDRLPPAARNPLEASLGMLERGPGSGGATAHPFHSEKVKSELELRRRRPSTLDADGRRAAAMLEEQTEPKQVFHDLNVGPSSGDP